MTTEIESTLNSFRDWLQATDEHAAYRLALLDRAGRLLTGAEPGSAEDRRRMAAKLQRWRYQHLNERAGRLGRRDLALADALDSAANELAGRKPRPPRATRQAIQSAAADGSSVGAHRARTSCEAARCFEPDVDLDGLVRRATELTWKHFASHPAGRLSARRKRRMLLYAPLYLSSDCVNYCSYCGFNYRQKIRRRHLTIDQALRQAEILRSRGFRHILLVAGDFPSQTTTHYHAEIIQALKDRGIGAAIEIAPQSTDSYAELVAAGACGITLYQETYDEGLYRTYHRRGPKSSFDWRLEGLDRAAEAGFKGLGLGILLGLADASRDLLALARHATYLEDRFPDRTFAFSLPRLHRTPDDFCIPHPVSDEELIRLYCALRVAFPKHELVLSTRETPALRERLARICITQLSAGSSTVPGGYEEDGPPGAEQFPVSDGRTPAEVAAWLKQHDFQPVWEVPPR